MEIISIFQATAPVAWEGSIFMFQKNSPVNLVGEKVKTWDHPSILPWMKMPHLFILMERPYILAQRVIKTWVGTTFSGPEVKIIFGPNRKILDFQLILPVMTFISFFPLTVSMVIILLHAWVAWVTKISGLFKCPCLKANCHLQF